MKVMNEQEMREAFFSMKRKEFIELCKEQKKLRKGKSIKFADEGKPIIGITLEYK